VKYENDEWKALFRAPIAIDFRPVRMWSWKEVVMEMATILDPKVLEAPFFAAIVGLTYLCGLLLLGQFL